MILDLNRSGLVENLDFKTIDKETFKESASLHNSNNEEFSTLQI